MTRGEAIKNFLVKSVLPAAAALLLVCIFKSACVKNGTLDYMWLWILCGLPFGLHRMCLWIIPGGRSFGGGIAIVAFGFIIGGVIGGFVLVWRLLVAVMHHCGEQYVRIPFRGFRGERCYDCNALSSNYHHWGCDAERCPVCGGQLISCECMDV